MLIAKAHYLIQAFDIAKCDEVTEAAVAAAKKAGVRVLAEPGGEIRVFGLMKSANSGLHEAMKRQPFSAFIEITLGTNSTAAIIDAVGRLGEDLGPFADVANSYAQVGHEYAFDAKELPVVFMCANARRLDTPLDYFHSYWLNEHGWLIKAFCEEHGTGYRQLHADPKGSYLGARAAGLGQHDLEGTSVAPFPSVEYFERITRDEVKVAHIAEDERRFVDHENSSAGLYTSVLHLTA